MSETIVPSFSDSTEKAIDEYYNSTSDNSSDNSSHNNERSSSDGGYTSGVPGLPLEVIQEQLRKPLALKLTSRPVYLRLVLWMKRRSSTVAQLVFIPKRVNKGLAILGHGTRSWKSLTPSCPSVENGAVILVLE